MPKSPSGTTFPAHPNRLLTALLALTFSASCSLIDARVDTAAGKIGSERAREVSSPAYPADCRDHTIIRPAEGERLDALALRYAWALADEHARTDRCATWYDTNFGDLN